jgi:hypothetical protein
MVREEFFVPLNWFSGVELMNESYTVDGAQLWQFLLVLEREICGKSDEEI